MRREKKELGGGEGAKREQQGATQIRRPSARAFVLVGGRQCPGSVGPAPQLPPGGPLQGPQLRAGPGPAVAKMEPPEVVVVGELPGPRGREW